MGVGLSCKVMPQLLSLCLLSHGHMQLEGRHFCHLLMSWQTHPELFTHRNFSECGPHISGDRRDDFNWYMDE